MRFNKGKAPFKLIVSVMITSLLIVTLNIAVFSKVVTGLILVAFFLSVAKSLTLLNAFLSDQEIPE